jgi:predicted nucleotidyltransferase
MWEMEHQPSRRLTPRSIRDTITLRVAFSDSCHSDGAGAMATAIKLTPQEMDAYRAAARRRYERERRELAQREEAAWELARRAATILRKQFGATRVMAFGSLVHEGCFTSWSDVDIAAWGIPLEDTFRAIGVVMDMRREIEVNLVDVGACSPSLRATIEREGVEL